MQEKELNKLVARHRAGISTEEEKALLESWYLQYHRGEKSDYPPEQRLLDAEAIWKDLQQPEKIARQRTLWPRLVAAASIIFCLLTAGYFLLRNNNSRTRLQAEIIEHKNDIVPGTNKAVLTLAKGKKISLSDIKNGQIWQQNTLVISKVDAGKLAYSEQKEGAGTIVIYDTLSVPRGGHFQVVFSDGSKAWLNASTIIRYPESFHGKERRIELIKGEAYFEVVHNAQKPFTIVTHSQVIEDVGTHFNINAYEDEPDVKTTLLEGSVKVTNTGHDVILKPGQQSVINSNHSPIIIKKANLDEVIAWKNDHFIFNDDSIESIMRQISRWYDVDIQYHGDMKGKQFTGSVSRFEKVSEVLGKLEKTGLIHFRIEGRRVIVTP